MLAAFSLRLDTGDVLYDEQPCSTAIVADDGAQALAIECDLCPVSQIVSEASVRPMLEWFRDMHAAGAPDTYRVPLRVVGVAKR